MTADLPQQRSALPARLLLACLLMGLTALIAQVVLTRELLGLFYGNELSVALVLGVWLLAVAAGSAAGAGVAPRLPAGERALGWSQLAIGALLPLCLLIARRVQPGDLTPGQVLGPGAMLLVSLQALAPACFVVGFQFVVAARAAAARRRRRALPAVAVVYALEAAGAVIGGAAFHWWFAQHVAPFGTLAVVGLLNLASASCLLRPRPSLREAPALAAIGALGLALLLLGLRAGEAELAALRASPRWSHLNPVAVASSQYGALVVTEEAGQTSLYQSGVLLFTSQDEQANETTAHFPLLEHPDPRRVLIIGGGIAGLAGEVLKHPVASVDCVELDPRVLEMARRWLPAPVLQDLDDARVHLHIGDARVFVRGARDRYDVVIVNLPDPTTAALNRFYTADFLREAKRALAPRGLLTLALTGSETQLTGGVCLAAASMDHTIARVFPDHLIAPGERMVFLAAEARGVLTSDWRVLSDRLDQRRVRTTFVNDAWLRNLLFPLRVELARDAISEVAAPRVNTDLNPVSYYYQTRAWLDQLSPAFAGAARFLSRISAWWALGTVVLAALVLALARGRRRRAAAVVVATVAMGGFGLAVEVLALLAFQSACGYLYRGLAALMAAFMAGLGLGAAAMSTREAGRAVLGRLLVAALAASAVVCFLLPGLIRGVLLAPGIAPVALGMALLLAGSLVGGAFPMLTALYARQREIPTAAGAVYAADLVGSAGAAVISGAIAVPLLGVTGVSLATGVCLVAALLLSLSLLRG